MNCLNLKISRFHSIVHSMHCLKCLKFPMHILCRYRCASLMQMKQVRNLVCCVAAKRVAVSISNKRCLFNLPLSMCITQAEPTISHDVCPDYIWCIGILSSVLLPSFSHIALPFHTDVSLQRNYVIRSSHQNCKSTRKLHSSPLRIFADGYWLNVGM